MPVADGESAADLTGAALPKRLAHDAQIEEQERQFREILEYCPAAVLIVDEDSRLLFHNARLRELLRYEKEELELIDTRLFWQDLTNGPA